MRMSSPILLATELNEGECFPMLPVENWNECELYSATGCTACINGGVLNCSDPMFFFFVCFFKEMIAMTTTNENVAPLHKQTWQVKNNEKPSRRIKGCGHVYYYYHYYYYSMPFVKSLSFSFS